MKVSGVSDWLIKSIGEKRFYRIKAKAIKKARREIKRQHSKQRNTN